MNDTPSSPTLTTYAIIYVALLALMTTTIIAAYLPLGVFNVPIALVIAFTKTVLVALFFMHVRYSGRLIWVVTAGALVWLAILLSTYHDYLTRDWTPNRLPAEPTDVPIELLYSEAGAWEQGRVTQCCSERSLGRARSSSMIFFNRCKSSTIC